MSYDYRHYWCLAKECRDAMRLFGRAVTEAEWEAERAAIHIKAGATVEGEPISSMDLTEELFKPIKAIFLSWSKPDDLEAQLAIYYSDFARWRWLADQWIDRIEAILTAKERHAEAAPVARGAARDGYLLAMFRRIGKLEDLKPMDTASKKQMWKVMSALVYRFDQVARKKGMGKGSKSPTRKGKPPLQRPFDGPLGDARPRPAKKLPACIKPVSLTESDDENNPF